MAWNSEKVYGYCIYWSLVWKLSSLCLWHTFNTNVQRMHQIGVKLLYILEALYKQVAVVSIDPFELRRINGKKLNKFLSNFFVTCLGCEITKINESQKTSACHVKQVLFKLEKKNQRGHLTPFGLLGLMQ